MRALVLVVLAVAAGDSRDGRDVLPDVPPVFRLLPGGTGNGVSQFDANGFCELFSSQMVGGYLCKDGDSSSGRTLSAVGAPATQTDVLCPNGPDCAGVTGYRTSAGNYFSTATTSAFASGDFFVWAFFKPDAAAVNMLIAKDDTGNRSFALYQTASGFTFEVFGGFGATSVVGTYTLTVGQSLFVLATYHRVADGSSVGTIYVNGSSVGTSSVLAAPGLTPAKFQIGEREIDDFPLAGVIYTAGYSETLPSAGTIADMTASFFPVVQGTLGEAVTATRATTRSCCSTAGCSPVLTTGACAHDGALEVTTGDQVTVATTGWPAAAGTLDLTYTPQAAIGSINVLLDTRTGGASGLQISRAADGSLAFLVANAGSTTSASAALSWTIGHPYKLHIQWGGGARKVWRDGTLVLDASSTTMPAAHGATASIGHTYGGSTNPANGLISVDGLRP